MAFEWPVRVYWEDTDAGGIVFHANYLKYFERARTEWLRARGIEQSALREQTGGVFVVSDAQLRYLRAARLDDALTITTKIHEKGRASMSMQQKALRKQEHPALGELLVEAIIRIGWVDASTLRPARMPLWLLERLS